MSNFNTDSSRRILIIGGGSGGLFGGKGGKDPGS